MTEQIAHNRNEPTDFTEVLFNRLRDFSLHQNVEFGTTQTELVYPGAMVGTLEDNTTNFYDLTARACDGSTNRLLTMGDLGLSFDLSHYTTTHLAPEETIDYFAENIPGGVGRLWLLPQELLQRMRSADEALLCISARYSVNTFYPDVQQAHALQLKTHVDGQESVIIEDQMQGPPKQHGITHLLHRQRLRGSRELREMQRRHMQQHILHILEQLGWVDNLDFPDA